MPRHQARVRGNKMPGPRKGIAIDMRHPAFPLWPLPLSIALLFLGAVHLAWWLSLHYGYIPPCNPYWDGCTSISRAARHGISNHLFRLVVLPTALLHLLNWWLAARWLRDPGRPRDVEALALLGLGAVSAAALALYATFLGTQGEAYELLRRYGVTLYFGCGYLAQLLFLRLALRRKRLTRALGLWMQWICVLMLMLGVFNTVATELIDDPAFHDRLENALEWQLGLLLVTWFAMQALAWRRVGLAMRLEHDEGQAPPPR